MSSSQEVQHSHENPLPPKGHGERVPTFSQRAAALPASSLWREERRHRRRCSLAGENFNFSSSSPNGGRRRRRRLVPLIPKLPGRVARQDQVYSESAAVSDVNQLTLRVTPPPWFISRPPTTPHFVPSARGCRVCFFAFHVKKNFLKLLHKSKYLDHNLKIPEDFLS